MERRMHWVALRLTLAGHLLHVLAEASELVLSTNNQGRLSLLPAPLDSNGQDSFRDFPMAQNLLFHVCIQCGI
jgi:hypothetical protein